ncbi:serine/threonine-protein kinase/endoribonuclease IRE1a-like [Euphorbia lathyris]|uniref:serine/threonine-protein kinase/endoribonuclease IRE1a-like n=1 Tax=Euphorbia lathyris TaxID=212925 RepID=UPI003313B663
MSPMLLDLNKLVEGGIDGCTIGKLFVSNVEIAKGSNGTIILEGTYGGRPVAVKRLVRAHNPVAFKEIQNLIASDWHQNIVRWYGVEYDKDFVYLSLERCICSLDDLIMISSDSSINQMGQFTSVGTEYNLQFDKAKGIMQGLNLWKANQHPSPLLSALMSI